MPVDREMKGAVLAGAGFGDVLGVGFALRGDELSQLRERFRRHVRSRAGHGQAFDGETGLHQVLQSVLR